MIALSDLSNYLNQYLEINNFNDYAPNGIQVEGCETIKKIILGVTACQALLDRAVIEKADLILVHHGYFWKGESSIITGIKKSRLKTLLNNNINLLAYHLPLDCHPIVGNNIQLAKQLNINNINRHTIDNIPGLVCTGELNKAISGDDFANILKTQLDQAPLYIPAEKKLIKNIAWCTGAAQDLLQTAIDLNADAYITGEVSERTVHLAREAGIHFYSAGHHATERYGIQALGEHLSQQFPIDIKYIDIPNPV